jgi:glucose 1-dehydrogenase
MALCAPYGAAKAGLNHMTQTIAVELADHRINVNSIEPGWIDTPGEHVTFSEETTGPGGSEAAMAAPWPAAGHRPGGSVFLASSDADYITGVVLPVDGSVSIQTLCRGEGVRS